MTDIPFSRKGGGEGILLSASDFGTRTFLESLGIFQARIAKNHSNQNLKNKSWQTSLFCFVDWFFFIILSAKKMLNSFLNVNVNSFLSPLNIGKCGPRGIWPCWLYGSFALYLTLRTFPRNLYNNRAYHMGEPASGQDEANPVLWFATRAGKIRQSCPLGISAVSRARKSSFYKSFSGQACSVNMDFHFVTVHKHAKKNLASIEPSWLKTIIMRCIN